MAELELTQKDVAKMLNIAQATANQKINNVRPLTLVEAEKLCEILEISPSEFNIYFLPNKLHNATQELSLQKRN